MVRLRAVGAAALCTLLTACGVDWWAFQNITHGPNQGATLVLVWLADSPVDQAQNLWVTIDRVELVTAAGPVTLGSTREQYDLLTLRNGVRAEIGRASLQPGSASALRLVFAPTGAGVHRIRVAGVDHDLTLSAAAATVTVPLSVHWDGEETLSLHCDLDGRMSVVDTGALWRLEPHATAVDDAVGGNIAGSVLSSSAVPVAGATVSAQQGGVEVTSTRTGADGRYTLGPLEPGLYGLVVTASGAVVEFRWNVTVLSGATTPGVDVMLAPAAPGSVGGTVPAGPATSTVRLYSGGAFVVAAGVDPVTGAYTFPPVPPGTYTAELWTNGQRVADRPGVIVTGGGTVDVTFP